MKTQPNFRQSSAAAATLLALALLLTASGCGKSVTPAAPLAPVTPVANDATAGQWKMIVLSSPTQISVPAPLPVNDPSYRDELAAIKSAQAGVSNNQQAAITEWSGGGVLRWNQILRELVSRSDLPPPPNDNGTYPSPDPNNPFAEPQYPFANPPYAARAYSYVAVAQYEALKVAWYYKYLYNRPAPTQVNSSINLLMPATGVPSYPSEDAVEAGVNTVLLKLLFPTSADEIDSEAASQQQAALISGRASSSDIAAGFALGQAVAAVFKARAANDGMKAAAGNAAVWKALADAATARGEVAWVSQDIPPRPPMLPIFGKVQGWMMSPTQFLSERPAAPPSTASEQLKRELLEVKQAVSTITDDQLATVYFWADGASSPTPPGHWNAIAEPYLSSAKFSEVRAARAFALLDMALHDAAVGCWDAKYFYFNPRPTQLDPSIRTLIPIPNFPSYESGHSTFSAAAAVVLSYLFPDHAATFNAMRDEAALSRLYGGIHYRSDIEVGKTHGARIANYTITFAQSDGAQ